MKNREIADLLGLDASTVGKWVGMGLPKKEEYTPQDIIQFLYRRWKDKTNPEEHETKRLIELEDLRKKRLANDEKEGLLIDKDETESIISRNLSILSGNLMSIPERECKKFNLSGHIADSLTASIRIALEHSANTMMQAEEIEVDTKEEVEDGE